MDGPMDAAPPPVAPRAEPPPAMPPPVEPPPPAAPPPAAPPAAPPTGWSPPGYASPPPAAPPAAAYPTFAVHDQAPPALAEQMHGDGSHKGVAILLAAAAIIAAVVGARSTGIASDATDLWQSALRTEVQRSAGALQDISYLYQSEVPQAVLVMSTRLQEAELRSAAAATTGSSAQALTLEADAQAGLLTAVGTTNDLTGKEKYALDGGGLNLSLRLADLRGENPDLIALDPDAIQAKGDALAAKASSMTIALLPLGIAALFGAIAQPFGGRRRLLLGLGTSALAIGVAIAVYVEVLG